MKAAITAIGGYVPDYILTNQELETMVETTDEWIRERTGITERRILKGEGQGTSVMALEAARIALEQRGIDPTEVECVILATVTKDFVFPATALQVAAKLGCTRAWGYDLEAACSGFLYALTAGAKLVESGMHKKVLVIGADKMSTIIDYTDRNTCIIFGDGAGAVLLEPSTNGYGYEDAVHYADGNGMTHLHMKAGGSVKWASVESVLAREHYVYQEGQPVFKQAVVRMGEAAVEVMQRNNLTANDIAWLIPHQANMRIISACADRAGIPPEKVMLNIQKYGNTTCGTLPLCMWDYRHQLKPGDKLILATFGGGFTWGATYVTWGLDLGA